MTMSHLTELVISSKRTTTNMSHLTELYHIGCYVRFAKNHQKPGFIPAQIEKHPHGWGNRRTEMEIARTDRQISRIKRFSVARSLCGYRLAAVISSQMSSDSPASAGQPQPSRRFGPALSLLAVALALLAFEAFYYFSAPPLDEEQKALAAWEGVRAPDFSMTNVDGQAVRLADLRGKRVIINFWATWCAPCLEELPNFIRLRAETSPTNVVILGLSTDDAATQKTFAQRNGVNYPLAVLQNVPSPYRDIAKIPVTLVMDRNGVIQHVVFSAQDFRTLRKFAVEPDFAGAAGTAPAAGGR
jgi:thiol-disulfide isomerase/thioredoxin